MLRKRAVYVHLLEQALPQIVERLSGLEGVERVSLFGSYAQGKRDLFTDLDILVIMETELGFIERLRMLYGIVASPVDLDLLCYTPQEFQDLKGQPFFRRIAQEEVVLYEKNRP
jgi:predicted nucleotidyltransferase